MCARGLGDVMWRGAGGDGVGPLPSRFEEGYGVSSETLTRLAGEGVGLVLTVDCGVTAGDEVARAETEVVVTGHHRAGPGPPACPGVGPDRGEYPFREPWGPRAACRL